MRVFANSGNQSISSVEKNFFLQLQDILQEEIMDRGRFSNRETILVGLGIGLVIKNYNGVQSLDAVPTYR